MIRKTQTINPLQIPVPQFHKLILGSVSPRPIAFASTIDKDGKPNLSPFSFFNAFGVNPSTLIFSPSRRGRDNTTKNTFENLKEVAEVVINMVTYDMVEQANLASSDYPKGINEFVKAGFTPIESEMVRPFRVNESPVQYECKVRDIIETGDQGGAANLVICEILLMHVDENVLDESGMIDPDKIDLVGRMGGPWYCRTTGDSKFKISKPGEKLGIGIDALPEQVRHSPVLTGNELAKLGGLQNLPESNEVDAMRSSNEVKKIFDESEDILTGIHSHAKQLIQKGEVYEAMKVLMTY
ncbi:MAG: flavin reductase family protein [Bacteroidales bacterium]|nr:flavin reductase family protein [Bacteroidales bacterium]MCF8344771.1 flavin reductase family protein [Bacteroidales bacterium]MCF8350559.1 flavin reductase family protein [Bacteroidales bacterium]MCF8377073.1 flavin reductase family protein [Bacteroidales bacterium]MCF8400947.1 flavin reductase family protein [Bacteroidales bacterium]